VILGRLAPSAVLFSPTSNIESAVDSQNLESFKCETRRICVQNGCVAQEQRKSAKVWAFPRTRWINIFFSSVSQPPHQLHQHHWAHNSTWDSWFSNSKSYEKSEKLALCVIPKMTTSWPSASDEPATSQHTQPKASPRRHTSQPLRTQHHLTSRIRQNVQISS
jgi:hypothetical protein